MLIAMAIYDTVENKRTELTKQCLQSLCNRVDFGRHRAILVDNGSCDETKRELDFLQKAKGFEVITLPENIGTARAINLAWKKRNYGEHAVKMDNDVVVYNYDWPDLMEYVFQKDPSIGICGLKRKDCLERPDQQNFFYRSRMAFLNHKDGEKWIPIEYVNHVMGTCQGYNAALLDEIGYLYQMGGLYGFDDALASVRAHKAGFDTVFVPHIEIDHIDPGGDSFTKWKQDYAMSYMAKYNEIKDKINLGEMPVYFGPEAE